MSRKDQQMSKREQARLAEQQAKARQARNARLAVVGTLVAVGAAILALVLVQNQGSNDAQPSASGGLLTGPPPWPAQAQGLAERVDGLGFPPPGDESYHAHVLLSVYRDGEQVPVPQDMGFGADGSHSSLHTHTPDGVIHMEADDPYPYELSHVFQVWGVAFGPDRLGGDVPAGDKRIHVYVNGEPAAADEVILEDGDNVVVAYGAEGSFPKEPPADALNAA